MKRPRLEPFENRTFKSEQNDCQMAQKRTFKNVFECCSDFRVRFLSPKCIHKLNFEHYFFRIQWGSEIQPFEIQKLLKSGLFEG